jgi:L-alanine-DL-glutamate epimerase-like enolase superfamily enzyme
MAPEITEIESIEFTYPIEDVARRGGKLVYLPGSRVDRATYATRVETDVGVAGEYVGGTPPGFDQLKLIGGQVIGRSPYERERIWADAKQTLRKYDGVGIGPLDTALWDLAGKLDDSAIHELLGTYRERFPAYASTYFATDEGGFESPADYADYAEACLEAGYPAFKLHTWCGQERPDIDREVATIEAVGERVGDEMQLMHDPVCEYETLADAIRVGRACDEYEFLWYEDPYSDGGTSQHGHRCLRQRLDTPILQTELLRGVEQHTDFLASEATDFLRADVKLDGGITGAMKIARIAEGFGTDVEFHLPGPAERHCIAATRNSNYYELGLVHPDSGTPSLNPPVYAGDYTDDLESAEDGTFEAPDGPGLGVTYDWSYIEDNATRRVVID